MLLKQSHNLAVAALASVLSSVFGSPTPSQLSLRSQAATSLCGDQDYIILQNSPWIVYNMLYNADVTVGTQCTDYSKTVTSSSGTQEVVWGSVTNIDYVQSTQVNFGRVNIFHHADRVL